MKIKNRMEKASAMFREKFKERQEHILALKREKEKKKEPWEHTTMSYEHTEPWGWQMRQMTMSQLSPFPSFHPSILPSSHQHAQSFLAFYYIVVFFTFYLMLCSISARLKFNWLFSTRSTPKFSLHSGNILQWIYGIHLGVFTWQMGPENCKTNN